MMTAKKSLTILFSAIAILLAAVAALSYAVDPQCFYSCPEIDVNKRTVNTYYQVAQRISAHPEAEIVILGSSRGENVPPLWVQEITGLKTLNLSSAGAEVTTKLAFLKIAEEKTKVRKVIWLADYFELVGATQDAKIKNTPALKRFIKQDGEISWAERLEGLQGLISHNNFEASLHFMKNRHQTEITQGSGSFIDYRLCESPDFKGNETAESLKKEIDLLYQSYVHGVINPPQSAEAWSKFSFEIKSAVQRGIEVYVVLIPYHPAFLARLKNENPVIYERHQQWITNVKELATTGLVVVDNFTEIPGTDDTFVNWNDGVHFNCRASMQMLKPVIQGWK